MNECPRSHPIRFGPIASVMAAFGIATSAFVVGGPEAPPAAGPAQREASQAVPRIDRLPRKVLLGTMLCDPSIFTRSLGDRLRVMDGLAAEAAEEAASSFPGKRLDLVVFPEYFLARPGNSLEKKSLRLDEVRARVGACAVRYGCYLVVPMLLIEGESPIRCSNAAVLYDRTGAVAGIYRKVHPVAPQGSDLLEDGTVPGASFPVFNCDFGRLGIQICFDMFYPDGWKALAAQGAEIVALPSASAETVRPSFYAMQNNYYVVSATPKCDAAVYSPLGLIEAQISKPSVLVHQIDLSYAILHWEAALEEGAALKRRFGDRVGFHYYSGEDNGIFWSNDLKMTIGQMLRSADLVDSSANAERIRVMQDKARGGPPVLP
jgi:predicted amidohydrolase